jgi:drug/metabolite transporter (DMT)-like permease
MLKHFVHLHFIVLLWGFTSILGKLMSIDALEIVFFRTLVAAIGFGAIILLSPNRTPWPSRRALLEFVATGAIVGLHWLLFFASAKVSKVSICLAGISTATLFTSLLEPLLLKTKMKWYEILLGLVVIAGLYTIFRFEFDHALGLGLALASAFLSALFSVINKHFTHYKMPLRISFVEIVGAWLIVALLIPVYLVVFPDIQLTFAPTALDWVYLLLLGLVCTVYAFYFNLRILEKLSVFTVNLAINMEPVYGIILAVLIFGASEEMTPGFYAGTLIILGSVAAHPFLEKKFGKA